jgi:hypothetical protein
MKKRTTPPQTPRPAACTHSTTPTFPPAIFRNVDLWSDNARKFTLFTERLIRRYPWQGSFDGRPPGKDAFDYIADAQILLIAGQRRCRVDEDPVLCIYGVLRSLVWHDSQRPENRVSHLHLVPVRPDDDSDDMDESLVPAELPDIEDVVTAREFLEKYKSNFSDERYRRYLDLLASDDLITAIEAAQELDLLESEVWNMRKVLKRPRKKWLGQPPAR